MTEHNLTAYTPDIAEENIKALRQLFPEVICEDKVDFDKLRQILGDYADDTPERYNFTWNGKGRALRLAQSPSTGTLRPCKEESNDWDTTQNLYIEGDNLEVLKLLQKTYHGKVKMIYIDPPYNTGGDFVYPDDYADNLENYLRMTGQRDEDGGRLSTNTEASGRYHTDWLNMMYPRLRLARNLLRDDGVIFISIDDNEAQNLRKLCDEVFGEDNFIATFVWEKRTNRENRKLVSSRHENIVCFAKNMQGKRVLRQTPMTQKALANYKNPDNDPRGLWKSDPATAQAGHGTKSQFYVLVAPNGKTHELESGCCWRFAEEAMKKEIAEGRIWFGKDGNGVPRKKTYLEEKDRGLTPESIIFAEDVGTNEIAKNKIKEMFDGIAVFETPKPVDLLLHQVLLTTIEDDIILDFFSGSATTAHAVMQLNAEDGGNRRFIMVQLQEPCDENSEAFKAGYKSICEIGKERIRRAGEKIKSEIEAANAQLKLDEEPKQVPDIGFKVFKLDSSNIKKWQPDRDNLEESLYSMVGNYVEGRTEFDVVYEIMLKYGIDLTLPLEEYTFGGKKVYSVGFGALIICLDDDITADIAKDIVELRVKLAPETIRVVMKDNGFSNDSVKTNVKETLRNASIDEFVTV